MSFKFKIVPALITFHQTKLLPKIFQREYSTKGDSRLLQVLSSMSRPLDKHIAEAQKQRQFLKERGFRYVPSMVTIQVLGSGAKGSPKSVYVFTDQSRYLFNCGEGTQRLAHEHKMKLARLEHIFFTSSSWRNIGGLPGVALTLQDVGVPKIILHGPSGLDDIFSATRKFVILKDMKISAAECIPEKFYEDSCMTIKYVPIFRNIESKDDQGEQIGNTSDEEIVEADNTDYYAHESSGRQGVKDININNLLKKPRKDQLCSMAYICKLKPCLGTLNLQKCVEKGVKPGPDLGLLKNGKDVTLSDGNIIYAKDVKTPDDPGPIFVVLEIPDERFLDNLLKTEAFRIHQEKYLSKDEDRPTIFLHFTPSHIFKDERYQTFMKMFCPETTHLILNDENICSGSVAVHRIQRKLNLLDGDIFPIIKNSGISLEMTPDDDDLKKTMIDNIKNLHDETMMANFTKKLNIETVDNMDTESNNQKNLVHAKTFTSYHLRPRKGLDNSTELKLNVLGYIAEAMNYPGFSESLQELYSKISSIRSSKTNEKYPKIVFFGTGSCIPNKTRNTSCILIHTDESNCMILDCGEGSFGQMVRFYGNKEIVNVMKNLKAIYVSHLHADHHLGLFGILQGRREIFNSLNISSNDDQKINLFAPKQIKSWLLLYDKLFERIFHEVNLIPNSELLRSEENGTLSLSEDILNNIGLKSLETCYVKHCPNSFGVSLETKQSKRITYSGDTMPCADLVRIGQGSDLLIHEATMEDDLASEARRKFHSTIGQAVKVGKDMKAKFTLLTHFSQRYARVPLLSPELENSKKNDVGIAFDNMQVTLDELPILPQFFLPLKLMFALHWEDLENKARKRAIKRERNLSPVPNVQQSRCMSSNCTPRRMKLNFNNETPKEELTAEIDNGNSSIETNETSSNKNCDNGLR